MHILRERSVLQWLKEGKAAKSTPEGCCTVWSSKPYPTPPRIIHGQASTSPRVCSCWIMLSQFGNRPRAPSSTGASAWILLMSHLLLQLQLQGLLMPMLPRLFVFVPGWRQAEAFLLSSFICFSGVKSSCHLAAPQSTYMIFLLAKGESCQNVKEKVLQRCC